MADPNPRLRSAYARLAANTRWSREDPAAPGGALSRARAAAERRFEDEVDPDRVLPEAERLRRAECARKAFYERLQLRAAEARRRKAAERKAARAAALAAAGLGGGPGVDVAATGDRASGGGSS